MGLKRNSDLDRELLPATSLGKGHEVVKQEIRLMEPPYRNPEWLRQEYWNNKQTIREIALKTGVCERTILDWMKWFNIKRRKQGHRGDGSFAGHKFEKGMIPWHKGKKHPHVKIKPNLNPSPELAYLIGASYGDASVTRCGNAWCIKLSAIDRDFVEAFRSCFISISNRNYSIFPVKGTNQWEVNASSKLLFEFLKDKNKHITAIENYPTYFLRAFFDGDGGATVDRVYLYNTNLSLLEQVRDLLERKFSIYSNLNLVQSKGSKNRIKGGIIETKKDCYKLEIHRKNDVVKFYNCIGFSIKRKQAKLSEIVRLIEHSDGRRITPTHEIDKLIPQMVVLKNQGFSCERIAKELDICTTAVWRRLH